MVDDDSVEQSVECSVRETDVLGENLPQFCFVHHKSQNLTRARTQLERRRVKPATNRLSYVTA
jgi:hypothetical protein